MSLLCSASVGLVVVLCCVVLSVEVFLHSEFLIVAGKRQALNKHKTMAPPHN